MNSVRCTNCGAEIPENMAFCGCCGTPNPKNNIYQNAGYYNPVNQNTANKNVGNQNNKSKKKKPLFSIVVIIVVFYVFSFIGREMADSFVKNVDSEKTTVTTTKSLTTKPVNSEYSDIFSSRAIVEPIDIFWGLDSAAFAKVDVDGIVEKIALGYRDDIVKEMHNVVYVPVSDYTEEQKQVLETEYKKEYAKFENYDSCTVKYNSGYTYFSIDVTFTELEKTENIKILVDLGLMGFTADQISMEKTREGLLGNGYIEK